jgi:hypothetical protein
MFAGNHTAVFEHVLLTDNLHLGSHQDPVQPMGRGGPTLGNFLRLFMVEKKVERGLQDHVQQNVDVPGEIEQERSQIEHNGNG